MVQIKTGKRRKKKNSMKRSAVNLCLNWHYCVRVAAAQWAISPAFSVWSIFLGACSASALRGADLDGANWCCPWCYHHWSYFSWSLLSYSWLCLLLLALSFVLPHLFLAERMPSAVLTLLVWAVMQFELPSNHLVQAEPMSATDYKVLTATLDSLSESSGATFFITSSYPAS